MIPNTLWYIGYRYKLYNYPSPIQQSVKTLNDIYQTTHSHIAVQNTVACLHQHLSNWTTDLFDL